jgi:cytochrome c oxidase cbb3-type subunit IV
MNMNISSIGETLSTFWTVWTVAICVGIAYWALRPANRKRFENDARIPFNDER